MFCRGHFDRWTAQDCDRCWPSQPPKVVHWATQDFAFSEALAEFETKWCSVKLLGLNSPPERISSYGRKILYVCYFHFTVAKLQKIANDIQAIFQPILNASQNDLMKKFSVTKLTCRPPFGKTGFREMGTEIHPIEKYRDIGNFSRVSSVLLPFRISDLWGHWPLNNMGPLLLMWILHMWLLIHAGIKVKSC